MRPALRHVELWTTDLAAIEEEWRWLLTALGWSDGHAWAKARTWDHPDGTYIMLEQSPDVRDAPQGWRELFADRYPHAGGPSHTALFLENSEGFEVEIVVG